MRNVAWELETSARVIRTGAAYLRYQADMLDADGLTDAYEMLVQFAEELEADAAERELVALIAREERSVVEREEQT